jgi:hypothetical protein
VIEYTGGGQEFCKVDQLPMRRGWGRFIPAHVPSPAQGVYHLGVFGVVFELGNGSFSPAFVFTHWVSVPNLRKPTPVLALREIRKKELRLLG